MKCGIQIYLAAIRDLAILFPGDLHELATFVLKARDTLDQEASANSPCIIRKSRPTLRGLAGHYAQLIDIRRERVEQVLIEAGFNLNTVVEFDPDKSASGVDRPRE